MPTKSFKEFIEELKNTEFEPFPSNTISSDGEFENWLHKDLKNPIVKWAKRCTNRDKLYEKRKKLGKKLR